jgi:excisionase family DNA binding protein
MAAPSNKSSGSRRMGFPGERVLASIILGVFMLIAAGGVSSKLGTLNETISKTTFAGTNSFSKPSDISYSERVYMNVNEAADYLNMTTDEVNKLLSDGEISDYVKTSSGYSIAKKALDDWFEGVAIKSSSSTSKSTKSSDE